MPPTPPSPAVTVPAPAFRRWRWLGVLWWWAALALSTGADEAGRVVVFGTVERLTPRDAPVRGLDDAAFDQDLAELVAKAAGLPYRIAEYKTDPEVVAAFERGEVDVIPSMARLPEREGKYLFSVRHTVSSAAVFMRTGARAPESLEQVAVLRLAVVRGSSPYSYLRRKGWLDRTQLFATTEEALRAVLEGSVEACVSNQLIGLSVLRQLKLEGKISPGFTLPDFSVEFCMAVRPANADLLARLNDGLLLASERGDLQRHREKWLPVFESYWLSRREVWRWFWIGSAALILVAGLSWRWYRGRLDAARRQTETVRRLVEQRTAELEASNRQLRASEEVFAAAFRASPDALSITRVADGRLMDVNGAFARIFGYGREEAIGRTRGELGLWWRPEEPEALQPTLRRDGRVREAVQRVRCKDGREIEVLFSTELTTVGGVECAVTISRDITEQSRALAALRASEERYQLAVRGSSAGLWDWNLLTNEVFYAPRFREMIGYGDGSEFPGHPGTFLEALHPEDRPAVEAALAASHSSRNAPYDAEYRLRTKTGEFRWFQARGEVLRDAAGTPYRMAGSIVDITQRKHVEGELRQLNAELEARVRERTTELARRVVEVEQLNAELESFSYSVSHDLRSPLRNITGFLELLEGRMAGRLEPDERRYIGTATREAGRLGVLIDDLLTFSRMGRAEMKFVPVSLAELVAEVRVELQPAIGQRRIEWSVGELPTVRGDRALLRLVWANLLGNAVKFTRHRPEAAIAVGALEAGAAADGLVTIFVRDNGAGFNPKYQDKLFGVFQRLHNTRDFEGTGIGLANVKRIVNRHGGRVWAEGNVDKGAVFYFSLPLHPPP